MSKHRYDRQECDSSDRQYSRIPTVAIVGAGMSGIALALALQDAGLNAFTMYDKASRVGGTWRENTYPGLTCDVPSHYYSYRAIPNPEWSNLFSSGSQIQEYLERVVRERHLHRHMKFGVEITSAEFDCDHWKLHTANGETLRAQVLVCATGVLHRIQEPRIEGIGDFAGHRFHSARWDHSVELDGARVGVIGSGSTGVQIFSALAGRASTVTLFQRTPQWVATLPNPRIPEIIKSALSRVPGASQALYAANKRCFDLLAKAVIENGWQRAGLQGLARRSLARVKDDTLRAALTPDYEPGCKRLIMSPTFYRQVQRDDVNLVTEKIERVVAEGLRTADGTVHPLDVLVTATGFDAHAYMRPMTLIGRDGTTIDEAWDQGPHTYRSVTVPMFPNFFMLLGPYSPLGNSSLVPVAETQARYVVSWLRRMSDQGLASVEVSAQATEKFRADVAEALPNTVWATGCDSWYIGVDGKPVLWPWTMRRFRQDLESPVPDDFIEIPRQPTAVSTDGVLPISPTP